MQRLEMAMPQLTMEALTSDGHQVNLISVKRFVPTAVRGFSSCDRMPLEDGFITGEFRIVVAVQILLGNDMLLGSHYKDGIFVTTKAPRGRITSSFNAPSIPERQVENLVAGFLDSLEHPPVSTKRYSSAHFLLPRTYSRPPFFRFLPAFRCGVSALHL